MGRGNLEVKHVRRIQLIFINFIYLLFLVDGLKTI